MLNIEHFKEDVLTVALETIDLYSPAAMELLLGTALKESGLRHLLQIDGGPARKYEGIGLGLSMAKQVVAMHHGDLWVESALGQGSTFSIALPVSGGFCHGFFFTNLQGS